MKDIISRQFKKKLLNISLKCDEIIIRYWTDLHIDLKDSHSQLIVY